jgi:hypothetical protein
MDFASLPVTPQGHNSVYILIDRLTKLATFIPHRTTDEALEVARLFLDHWVANHGLPRNLTSDRDSKFVSDFWQSLVTGLDLNHRLTTARHQSANGQSESTVDIVKDMLHHYASYKADTWDRDLPLLTFAYNDSLHASTGFTPFFLHYGRHPTLFPELPPTPSSATHDLLTSLSDTLAAARRHIRDAQDRMVAQSDRHRIAGEPLHIGDEVLVDRDGLQFAPDMQRDAKLLPRFLGPFAILAVEGLNYTLKLAETMTNIHPTFHRQLLKKYVPPSSFPGRVLPLPPIPDHPVENIMEVEAILDHRTRYRKQQYLVQWVALPLQEATWEPLHHLTNCADLFQAYHQQHLSVPTPQPRHPRKARKKRAQRVLRGVSQGEVSRGTTTNKKRGPGRPRKHPVQGIT